MELTDEKLRQVIKQVIAEECDPNRVQVSVSNHHIHLTEEDFKTLFPHGKMEAFKPLKQPGEYATANGLRLSALLVRLNTFGSLAHAVRILKLRLPVQKPSLLVLMHRFAFQVIWTAHLLLNL